MIFKQRTTKTSRMFRLPTVHVAGDVGDIDREDQYGFCDSGTTTVLSFKKGGAVKSIGYKVI